MEKALVVLLLVMFCSDCQSEGLDVTATLQKMEDTLKELKEKIAELQATNEQRQVAFSASLLASGAGDTGPFHFHTTLVFKHVVSNIGNAYNPGTGFFTAPVKGAYHFEYYIYTGGRRATEAVLVKNGELIFAAREYQSSGTGTAANGATLLLDARDVVLLRLWQNNIVYDNQNHHSTFSGHLLFPM